MCSGAMGKQIEQPLSSSPSVMVPRILNECQHSQATHPRGIKKLVECRAKERDEFLQVWKRCLEPLFLVGKREPVVERMLKFAASFTAYWDKVHEDDCESFVEEFLSILLKWVDASHKFVRFRACQMISEVILKLPEDIPVAEELWDNIISSMQRRMQDKLTSVRVYAARALSRLVITDDIENDRTVTAYRQALDCDQSAEVRKMVVMSMPAMNVTVADMVKRTADISEVVRKATYQILGSKFRIQSLSIMQRALILQRGLAERVPGVRAECVELLKIMWLERDCEGNILSLLRYLDVETHEKVAENVMLELLKQDLDLKTTCSGGLRQFLPNGNATEAGGETTKILNAEQALYWRMLCTHLHSEAEAKGGDAATTGGAEAVVKAAAAADSNDYLERILPPTVAEYVHLVEAHVQGGSTSRFAARQLLSISKFLNFTDNTSRREAALLLQSLLGAPEAAGDVLQRLEELVGDGLNLGGDQLWANSVADLAHRVHASPGEFAQVLSASLAEHARPCREGGADIMQWLHCLAITGLLLENIESLQQLFGLAIEHQEIHDSLLMPAVKHIHPEVQRAGTRCLGIFCGLEKVPNSRGVEQLRLYLLSKRYHVQEMSLRAMFDLVLGHGATVLDGVLDIGPDDLPQLQPQGLHISELLRSRQSYSESEHSILMRLPLLKLLAESFDPDESVEKGEILNVWTSVLAEGFAKLLLQSKRFPDTQQVQDGVLENLVRLYFSVNTENSPRIRQCLNVFFRSYCSQAAENKRSISKVFVSVMRKEWPGICGNRDKMGTVLAARKHAMEIGRFMLHLLQLPTLEKSTQDASFKNFKTSDSHRGNSMTQDGDEAFNEGHEELAVRICSEVISFEPKKSMAGKTYITTLCRFATVLQYRSSQQDEVKYLCHLLPRVIDCLPPGEKTLLKDLKQLQVLLKLLDLSPDKSLTNEELQQFRERMGIDEDIPKCPEVEETPLKQAKATGRRRASSTSRTPLVSRTSSIPQTPIPPSTRTLRKRPETLSRLTEAQALKNLSPTKVTRKNLGTFYESDETDSDSDPATSTSGSEFEIHGSRLKGKACVRNSIGTPTSKEIPRPTTGSVMSNNDRSNVSESRAGDRSESEGDDREDEASPLPGGRRVAYFGARRPRMRKIAMERDATPSQTRNVSRGRRTEQFPTRSTSVSERHEDISSDEATSICTSASFRSSSSDMGNEPKYSRHERSSRVRNSVDSRRRPSD